jgi:predicted SnoaL-like aldol condensation-catalyzing enzyme
MIQVGREDAVRFLEDVKKELNSIRTRYAASVSQGQQAYVDQHEDLSSPNVSQSNAKPCMKRDSGRR